MIVVTPQNVPLAQLEVDRENRDAARAIQEKSSMWNPCSGDYVFDKLITKCYILGRLLGSMTREELVQALTDSERHCVGSGFEIAYQQELKQAIKRNSGPNGDISDLDVRPDPFDVDAQHDVEPRYTSQDLDRIVSSIFDAEDGNPAATDAAPD